MKSTIDWCELNYSVSEYIAEYWNTITGLFLIVSGFVFYYVNRAWFLQNKYDKLDTKDKSSDVKNKFINIINLLTLVGIGTMLFHGTLFYPFQLLDELPMIFLAREYISILVKLQTTQKCFDKLLLQTFDKVILLTKFLPIFISLSYFIYPFLQIISFHITLKITEISVIVLLYTLSMKLNPIAYNEINKKYDYLNKSPFQKRERQNIMLSSETSIVNRIYSRNKRYNLFKFVQNNIKTYIQIRQQNSQLIKSGLFFYGLSVGIWCVENLFCDYVRHLQLHACWHILSSIGIYKLNNIILNHVMINDLLFDNQRNNVKIDDI